MNPSIEALLDLQVIDKRRLALKQAREQKQGKVADAEKTAAAAEAAAVAATSEVERMGALIRQYNADVERCDIQIAEQRSKQMAAKTNKEYMAIINAIENAKQEKANREQSVKDLGAKVADLEAKAKAAQENAAKLRASSQETQTTSGGDHQPGEEELKLQAEYDAIKAKADPAFVEAYERLVKAQHKMPLMRIDPKSRSTPYGSIISHNMIEQIRMGKLVIERGTNSILFVDEGVKKAGG